jgi:RNA polymerase sigma-70 factor (ECF subfamily)
VGATRGGLAQRLYDEYGPALQRYLRFATRNRAEADDLAQEVFLRIARAAGDFAPRERDRSWVFRIARNVLIDAARRRGRASEVTADWDVRVEPTQATATDLRRALNRLPNEERDAFLLAEVGGLTYTEIAAAIDSTVAAVRSRIYRARLSLRDQLMPPAPIQSATVSMREDDD